MKRMQHQVDLIFDFGTKSSLLARAKIQSKLKELLNSDCNNFE